MEIAIIGGGPAGLRAAEVAARGGASVSLYEGKASVGRKFLVAGRGGLNLTHAEPAERFAERYAGSADWWRGALAEFGAIAMRDWAEGLGVETFAASTGRVYPKELKAAPLLRRWVERLRSLGVQFAMQHRWTGVRRANERWELDFAVAGEERRVACAAVIFAMGGGSWPQTGSDGGWMRPLGEMGVQTTSLQPANCGWEVAWSPDLRAAAEGQPLKSIAARAGEKTVRGELLITRYGLEGGALYQLTPTLREMAPPVLNIDLKPDQTVEQLVAKMGPIQRNFLAEAQVRWRLSPAAHALLAERAQQVGSVHDLARLAKDYRVELTGPRPLAEAISTAGGIAWSELTPGLGLRRFPGLFVAGEMIDWEAPTGGYLLQGCFATGQRAAQSALAWVKGDPALV